MTSLYAASIAFVGIIVLVVLYRTHRRARLRQVKWWVVFANQHRLDLTNPGEPHDIELEGAYRGVQVKACLAGGHASRGLGLYTHVEADVPGGVPPGLIITTHGKLRSARRERRAPQIELGDAEIGSLYDVYGADEDKTQELMQDSKLRDLLLAVASVADFVRIDSRRVTVQVKGVLDRKFPGFVDLTCRVAAGVAEAHERPWIEFAQEHGLLLRGAGTSSSQRVLRGHIRGQRVSVEMGLLTGSSSATFTTIKIGLGIRLPAGFRMGPLDGERPRGSFTIGHAGLDAVLQVQGTNRQAITALLTQPALRDHLVAFYEACPYTIVEHNAVIAGGPGLLCGDMGAQVAAVMDLAVAIRKAWAKVQAAPTSDASDDRAAANR